MGIIPSILLTLFCVRLALFSLENIKVLHRGYYMATCRYKFSSVEKYFTSEHSEQVKYFST